MRELLVKERGAVVAAFSVRPVRTAGSWYVTRGKVITGTRDGEYLGIISLTPHPKLGLKKEVASKAVPFEWLCLPIIENCSYRMGAGVATCTGPRMDK